MTAKKHYRNYPEDALYELYNKTAIELELSYRDSIIKALRAEVKELEKYKVRFDWLITQVGVNDRGVYLPTGFTSLPDMLASIENLDRLIAKAVQND